MRPFNEADKQVRAGQQAALVWMLGTVIFIVYIALHSHPALPVRQFESLCNRAIAPVAAPELGGHRVVYRYGARTSRVKNVSHSRFTAVRSEETREHAYNTMYGTCGIRNGGGKLSDIKFE